MAQAAAYLQISRTAVYRLRSQIPSFKVPGVGLRFRRNDLDEFMERHRIGPLTRDRSRPPGTKLATCLRDDEEILPGLTRGELIRQAGF